MFLHRGLCQEGTVLRPASVGALTLYRAEEPHVFGYRQLIVP